MHSKTCGIDLKGGHLVQGHEQVFLPRQEVLFGSVQSQKSQQVLELHRKYKQRLMHPLQVNQRLRMSKELDFLVPERDFLTWVQFSGLDSNPEVEKLMEHVKSISSFSQNAFRGKSSQHPSRPLRKEDFLKKNLPKEVYQKVKLMKKKNKDKEETQCDQERTYRETLGPEEEDTTVVEDKEQKEREMKAESDEVLSKQLAEVQHKKKNLKQLTNNVYFRYTNRKLLLLRSLGSLPSKEEIVKTFLQKGENNYVEKDQEYREKLKQQLSNDARLIVTHKQNLLDFQQKLRGRGSITIEDVMRRCSSASAVGQEKERVSVPVAATENFDTARGPRTSYRGGEYNTSPVKGQREQREQKEMFPSTLQHLDDGTGSGVLGSDSVETVMKDSKASIENIKESKRFLRDIKGIGSVGTYSSGTIKSQAMVSTRCQTRQDVSFEQSRKRRTGEEKVYERHSVGTGCQTERKSVTFANRSPEAKQRVKPLAFTKTMGFGMNPEQRSKTPLRCVSRGKILEMANRTPEKPSGMKPVMGRVQHSARLETEPENSKTFREDRTPCKEGDLMRMQQTERFLDQAWREPEPRNTVGHAPERGSVEGETEAILSSYGYRDYSLIEARRSVSAQKARCKSSQRGRTLRDMMEKTENTLKSMILRKQKNYDLDERIEMSVRGVY